MAVTAPLLVAATANEAEAFMVPVDGETIICLTKAHKGEFFPSREIEIVSVEDVVAEAGGPLFINHELLPLQEFDEAFHRTSAVLLTAKDIRIYWSKITTRGTREIRQMDYNLQRRIAGPVTVLPFEGDDPHIIDGRPVLRPQPGTWTWDGTLVVQATDTTGLVNDNQDLIRLDSDGQWFAIDEIDPNVSVTLQETAQTIPTAVGPTSAIFTEDRSDRLYLMYIGPNGSNAVRFSDDLGATWSAETVFDPPGSGVELADAIPTDPLAGVLDFVVLQKREDSP
jgi:hypothetical protein